MDRLEAYARLVIQQHNDIENLIKPHQRNMTPGIVLASPEIVFKAAELVEAFTKLDFSMDNILNEVESEQNEARTEAFNAFVMSSAHDFWSSELREKHRISILLQDYNITDGIVRDPGKFEGEEAWTIRAYDAHLNGDGDEYDNVVLIRLEPDEVKEWGVPGDNIVGVVIEQDSQGFVLGAPLNQSQWDAEMAHQEERINAEDGDIWL